MTQLKIRHNPFAKAFQDNRERPLDPVTVPSPASSSAGVSGSNSHTSHNSSNVSNNMTTTNITSGIQITHQTHSHHQQQGQNSHHNSSAMHQQMSQSSPSPPSLMSHSLGASGHHSYSGVTSNLSNSNGTRYPNVNFLSFYGRNHHRTLEGELAPSPISSSSDELNIANGTNAKEYLNSTLGHEVLTPTSILEGDVASIHGRSGDSLMQLTELEGRHPGYAHHHALYSTGHHEHGTSHHRHRRAYHPYAHHGHHGHGSNFSPPCTGDSGALYCKFMTK